MKNIWRYAAGASVSIALICGPLFIAPALAAHTTSFQDSSIPWIAGPTTLPAGTQLAVLEGDPKKSGLFTMRVRFPAGARIMPHWHPKDERVTVLSGAIHIAHGKIFSTAGPSTFYGTGAYYVVPATTPHFAWTSGKAVLQVTGLGPWELHPIAGTH